MESPGLTEYCGLAGKPGGERGDDPGDWREERGGGVRRDSAAGTDGAGLGAALAGAEGEGAVTSPLSWVAIFTPATHSVSRFLARSITTFPFM